MAKARPAPKLSKDEATTALVSFRNRLDRICKHDDLGNSSTRTIMIFLMVYGRSASDVLTVRGIAEEMDIPKPSVSRAFDRLEGLHLIQRKPDPDGDKRSVVAGWTAKGTTLYIELAQE